MDQPQDLRSEVFVYGKGHPAGSEELLPMSIINIDELLGRPFWLPMDENGERKWATILCPHTGSHPNFLRGLTQVPTQADEEQLDDLISYNHLMEYLADTLDTGQTEDGLYRFQYIQEYRGPYSPSDPEYI